MPLTFKLSWWIACTFGCLAAAAQEPVFTPFLNDPAADQQLSQTLSSQYESLCKNLTGDNKKYVAEIYKERYEALSKQVTEQEVMTTPAVCAYLDKLTSEILRANPSLQSLSPRIYFSRSYWPNAASMGEGTILFNIGLFSKLRNESQAAFVICHELAHLYMDHGNQSILQYVNTLYSDEVQQQLKAIKKSEYLQRQQAEKLTKHLAFGSRRHSREHEHEADSVAIEFMKHTRFDLHEALSCLALLDTADKDKYDYDLALAQRFNFPDYPFKNRWLETGGGLTMQRAHQLTDEEKDSLKTHPDCTDRVKELTPLVNQYQQGTGIRFITDSITFSKMQDAFDLEIVDYCFRSRQVSRSLYYSLEMLQVLPANPYLHTMTGKCLNEFYNQQQQHHLNDIVELPTVTFPERYNTLLHFIQNIRLSEIAAIAYYFLQQEATRYAANTDYNKALNESKTHYTPAP